MHGPRLHFALLVAVLAACMTAGRGLPLVRNSLVYARAAWNVIAAGYDPRPVVADSRLSYDKPIGFAWLSAPLVARAGAHTGLRLMSFAGTIAYLLAASLLGRVLLGAGEWRRRSTAILWLAGFGPLVLYQAWSAHPDAWFAALFAVTIALTHRLATRDAARAPLQAALLAVTLGAAFLLKNYALVLLPACLFYVWWHVRDAPRPERAWRRLLWCGLAAGIVGAFAVAARMGVNPWSRLEGEGGGAEQYALAKTGSIWWKTLVQCGVALVLQFHVAWFAALRRRVYWGPAFRPWVCFGLIYVVGLLPFPTAFYNMRYFLPLFPLAAIDIALGLAALRPESRRGIAVAFIAINTMTSLVFNVPRAYEWARPALPDLRVAWLEDGPRLSLLDNLRMEQHLEQAAWLRTVNEKVEPGAVLYMVDAVYYRDAAQGVFERDGLIRRDISTRYVRRAALHPAEPHYYIYSFSPRPLPLETLGRVRDFGNRVFRVDAAGGNAAEPALQ